MNDLNYPLIHIGKSGNIVALPMPQIISGEHGPELIRVGDGWGGYYEVIQYPMPPEPYSTEMQLVPYDQL